jgi:hypothetical protein
MSFPARVADRAADIKISRVLLTILACPFYVLGFLAGLLIAAVTWSLAAARVGFGDARTRGEVEPERRGHFG